MAASAFVGRAPSSILGRLRPRRLAQTWRWFRAIRSDVKRRATDPRLSVGIDAAPLWEEMTGIGWSLHKLIEALADRDDLAIRLYGPSLVAFDPPKVFVGPPFGLAVETVRYPIVEDLSLPPSWQVALLRLLAPRLVRADQNDVLHAHNFFLPRLLRPLKRTQGQAQVVFVHDLAMRHFPWTLEEERRQLLDRFLDDAISGAGVVITPSRSVRAEVVAQGLAPEESVVAIHHGPGHLRTVASSAALSSDGVADGDSAEPFALHVGTLEPRKNLETLLAAWSLARRQEPRVPRLVLCGATGWKNDELRGVIEQGVSAGWLMLPGYVSQEQLWRYYRQAAFLACPSLYEGFGLPLVEAMSAGTPLLLSDITVFREVAGDAAEYVDAADVDGWVRAIIRLTTSPQRQCDLSAAARDRAQQFSWETSAEQVLEIWQRLGESASSKRTGRTTPIPPRVTLGGLTS